MRVTVQVNWLAATLAVLLETDELVATELRATELTLLATLLEAAAAKASQGSSGGAMCRIAVARQQSSSSGWMSMDDADLAMLSAASL